MSKAQPDYVDSGFDGFLSRSVDELSQANLDASGPFSQQVRYDASQLSGPQGDGYVIKGTNKFIDRNKRVVFQEGALNDDNFGIQFLDSTGHSNLQISRDSEGNTSIKASAPGSDAATTPSSEINFDSSIPTPQALFSDSITFPAFTATLVAPYQIYKDTGIRSDKDLAVVGFVETAVNPNALGKVYKALRQLPYRNSSGTYEVYAESYLVGGVVQLAFSVEILSGVPFAVPAHTIHYNVLSNLIN